MFILCIFFKVPSEYSQRERPKQKRKIRHTEIKSCSPPPEHEAQEVGPCHHDMVRPQVVDGGTASNNGR